MKIFKRLLLGLLALVLIIILSVFIWLRSMGLFRTPVYDTVSPPVPELSRPAILVFSKTNGHIHTDGIAAANALFQDIAQRRQWAVYLSENGAVHTPEYLARFDVVIWNNVTGDVLTLPQRDALRTWIENGGRWVGLHGTGSGSSMDWEWERDELIGARYLQHTLWPPQATAKLMFEASTHPVLSGLPEQMLWKDELYSFAPSPRARANVLASLDEASYMDDQPGWYRSRIEQGKDHPIIWWRPVGKGISFYSALGHSGEAYERPVYRRLLENTLAWLITQPVGAP